MNKKQKSVLWRLILSSLLTSIIFLANHFLNLEWYVLISVFIAPYLIIGYDVLKKAWRGIINLKPFDENFLMALATIGAFILGEYLEAVAVIIFYQVGELFQSVTVRKSRKNISELLDIRPDYANVKNGVGALVQVDPFEISIGEIFYVLPGEKVPLDGTVLSGFSTLNTSALTGESMPREICKGEEILSGSINLSGILEIKATKNFENSTASKILELVENATAKKSKSENFISKFASVYTPIVVICAILLGLLPPIIRLIGGFSSNFNVWFYRALSFLVVSCPCALVISVPLGFFASIGGASSNGILIKGSSYLETLSKVKYALIDKTGTLTSGAFKVTKIAPLGLSQNDLLKISAHAESYSSHPVAKSIKMAYNGILESNVVENLTEVAGKGIVATVFGKKVLLGNEKLLAEFNVTPPSCNEIGTVVHVTIDQVYAGYIVISDVIKNESYSLVKDLKEVGLKEIIMLTGDNCHVANYVANKLSFTKVYSQLLPADKLSLCEQYINNSKKGEKVLFVGDGINDAPSLAQADVGMSMGQLGSDCAIEASDVVIVDDNPKKIAKTIKIAKKCMRIIYQNIFFSIGVKVSFLILSAFGFANMWMAIFADVGVMILAVLNSIRCLKIKK